MLALYRAGRHAEALRVYEDSRRRLAEELGLEPSDALKRLQRAVLEKDPALEPPAVVAPSPKTPTGRRRKEPRASRALFVVGGAAMLAAAVAVVVLELTSEQRSAGLGSLSADSIGQIDPHSNRLVAEIPAGARPSAVTYSDGS